VRFPHDETIPFDLIGRIAKFKAKAIARTSAAEAKR
jgi:hypothetical protein